MPNLGTLYATHAIVEDDGDQVYLDAFIRDYALRV
jgi:hypothetical protein